MADALADLLREIENMRKERGELRTKNATLEADLARCQGNLQAMTEDYISECQQLRDELAKFREWKHIADGLMARAELDQHTIATLREAVGEAVKKTMALAGEIDTKMSDLITNEGVEICDDVLRTLRPIIVSLQITAGLEKGENND